MSRQITNKSSIHGKAYEYACVLAIEKLVSNNRKIVIIENSSMQIAKHRYFSLSTAEQQVMLTSAASGIRAILTMEPRIIEDGADELSISLQPDQAGKTGDVRDVLMIRKSIDWEIGISVKHNHYALKHSRLSLDIDFGEKWFGIKCS